MNSWLSDSSSIPNNNHAAFASAQDNPMAFLQPPSNINPAQFQNQAFMNGGNRNASPAFHNPVYQTNQVIPSKRQREESLGTSPRQAPAGLPDSRSQTPGSGAYPGYNPQANGAPHFQNAPNAYGHLQQGATSNATPSPIIQNMNFNPNGGQQRVSTASPNPFSPHHGGPQNMSPAPSDHAGRIATPHDTSSFMQSGQYGAAFSQAQFAQAVNGTPGQMQMNPQMSMAQQQMQAQGLNAAQRNYQLQIQAQARQMQAQAAQAAQARSINGAMPSAAAPPMPPNNQMAAMQQAGQPTNKSSNPEEFAKGLQQFMAVRGRSVDLQPIICGRPIQALRLFFGVVRMGGSSKVTQKNLWPFLSQQFGFQPGQSAQAAQEMLTYWMVNLAPYEAAWIAGQQKSSAMRAAAESASANQALNQALNQASPARNGSQGHDANPQSHMRTQSDMQAKLNGQLQNTPQQGLPNGYSQLPNSKEQQYQQQIHQHRSSLSRQFDGQQPNGVSAPIPAPSTQKRPDSASIKVEPDMDGTMPIKMPMEDPFQPAALPPSRYHGPLVVDEVMSVVSGTEKLRPTVPAFRELGVIDIHALTMQIKCGMHAETRTALDTLVLLSVEHELHLSLEKCEDLIDTLVDCAQDQLEFLAEHASEVSPEMQLLSYEEVVRGCRLESHALRDVPQFGSLAYDLDRAADRLICITTLIRNFSFYEVNHGSLSEPCVIQLLSNSIRQLGTKEMLLRSNRNTLDFMKDIIIYLSNLSHSIQLPGKEEAYCLLQFLLSFAPNPPPMAVTSDKVSFTMYNPKVHQYMPSAVDSLAKLLARDEPNRTFYKAIFAADAGSVPPYDLLTKTFGLAISPLPANIAHPKATVEARKPFLLQGMLAAEILSNLVPSSDHDLARSWLESDDGFARSLLRLVGVLSGDQAARNAQVQQRHPPHQHARNAPQEQDPSAYGALAFRSMNVLKNLAQRSRRISDKGEASLPPGVMPNKEMLLGAMIQKDIDPGVLRMLCVYAGLED